VILQRTRFHDNRELNREKGKTEYLRGPSAMFGKGCRGDDHDLRFLRLLAQRRALLHRQ
jgi:hypothetical protein